MKLESVENKNKSIENNKKKNFKPFFLYDGANYRPPQPKFLNSCCNLLSNLFANFQKNQLDASETGKS